MIHLPTLSKDVPLGAPDEAPSIGLSVPASSTWALIPIKAPGAGKTRLAKALPVAERERLVEVMLSHVSSLVSGSVGRTIILGPERHGFLQHIEYRADLGSGLNGELSQALKDIATCEDPPARLLIIHADLPYLEQADLDRLIHLPLCTIGLAPDRHGLGTNALSLPLPQAANFHFRFGENSAAQHFEMAETLELTVDTIITSGLEKDIDEPSDLTDALSILGHSL